MRSRGELLVGLLVSAGSVAFVSAAIEVLRPYMPVLSLGVLYVFAVLAVAVFWGIVLGVAVSIVAAAPRACEIKFRSFETRPFATQFVGVAAADTSTGWSR